MVSALQAHNQSRLRAEVDGVGDVGDHLYCQADGCQGPTSRGFEFNSPGVCTGHASGFLFFGIFLFFVFDSLHDLLVEPWLKTTFFELQGNQTVWGT